MGEDVSLQKVTDKIKFCQFHVNNFLYMISCLNNISKFFSFVLVTLEHHYNSVNLRSIGDQRYTQECIGSGERSLK